MIVSGICEHHVERVGMQKDALLAQFQAGLTHGHHLLDFVGDSAGRANRPSLRLDLPRETAAGEHRRDP